MKLSEVSYPNGQPIDGYGNGFFRIGGAKHEAPLLLLPTGAQTWAGLDDVDPLVAARDVDVLLIGMGDSIAPLSPEMTQSIEAAGMGVEPMASAQACRTYNVLLGEGRRVAVALMPITRT